MILKRVLTFFAIGFAAISYAKPVVIIDSGHQPSQVGALGTCGKKEFVYNDELVSVLFRELAPSYHVFLTRLSGKETDTSDSLQQYLLSARDQKKWAKNKRLLARPAMANVNDAQVFISIHHDSVVERNKKKDRALCQFRGGKTVKEAFKKKFHIGFNVFIYDRDNDLRTQNSLRLANNIATELILIDRYPSNYHDGDCKTCHFVNRKLGVLNSNFAVLRNTKMPAVLIEVGNIADAEDEAKVNNDQFRKKFAVAMKLALKHYFQNVKPIPIVPTTKIPEFPNCTPETLAFCETIMSLEKGGLVDKQVSQSILVFIKNLGSFPLLLPN